MGGSGDGVRGAGGAGGVGVVPSVAVSRRRAVGSLVVVVVTVHCISGRMDSLNSLAMREKWSGPDIIRSRP
jgi:hypothetical protein